MYRIGSIVSVPKRFCNAYRNEYFQNNERVDEALGIVTGIIENAARLCVSFSPTDTVLLHVEYCKFVRILTDEEMLTHHNSQLRHYAKALATNN